MKHKIDNPPQGQTERLQLRVSKEFLQAIDSWRREQPDLPPRAESIRRLVDAAIAAMKSRKIAIEASHPEPPRKPAGRRKSR